MLGSFGSSSHEEEEDPSPPDHVHYHQNQQIQHRSNFTSPAIHMRQLLISCAELISSRSDPSAAPGLITILLSNSTPYGDSTERLVHQFTRALSLRLNRYITTSTTSGVTTFFLSHPPNYNSLISTNAVSSGSSMPLLESDEALLQSAYLSLNQVTPFIRFSQLTANQAILDAIEGEQAIHILDFNIMHGLQWPPFMQAIMERFPPPSLRITGTGSDLETLRRTGDRLAKFAHSLGLRFQFHPLLLLNEDDPISVASSVLLLPGETLAVNCVLYLHRLLKDRDGLRLFLHSIKAMNPKIVTLAEREANHNHPLFLQRFVEALDHYAAIFDSLEATLDVYKRQVFTLPHTETLGLTWVARTLVDSSLRNSLFLKVFGNFKLTSNVR